MILRINFRAQINKIYQLLDHPRENGKRRQMTKLEETLGPGGITITAFLSSLVTVQWRLINLHLQTAIWRPWTSSAASSACSRKRGSLPASPCPTPTCGSSTRSVTSGGCGLWWWDPFHVWRNLLLQYEALPFAGVRISIFQMNIITSCRSSCTYYSLNAA